MASTTLLSNGGKSVSLTDVASGTKYWSIVPREASNGLGLLTSTRAMFSTLGKQLIAIDRVSGSEVWTATLDAEAQELYATPTHIVAVVGTSPTTRKVYGINESNGSIEWTRFSPNLSTDAVATSGWTLWLGELDRLVALDSRTGKAIRVVKLPGRSQGPLLILPSVAVAVVSVDGATRLVVVNSEDGKLVASILEKESIKARIAFDGQMIVVLTYSAPQQSQELVGINSADWRVAWRRPIAGEPALLQNGLGGGALLLPRSLELFDFVTGAAIQSIARRNAEY